MPLDVGSWKTEVLCGVGSFDCKHYFSSFDNLLMVAKNKCKMMKKKINQQNYRVFLGSSTRNAGGTVAEWRNEYRDNAGART